MSNTLPGNYTISLLDEESAKRNADEIAKLADSIPLVTYSTVDVLASNQGGRRFIDKWLFSHWIKHNDTPVGMIIGYYRKADGGPNYPSDSVYISELAIAKTHQQRGLAKALITTFLVNARKHQRIRSLKGQLRFTVQTNSAVWNQHVQKLYESFGFQKRRIKKYDNRTDWIMEASDDQLII
ncbi:MAG: hypothetical protein BA863_18225 [Desulfovibrio sp. S3730MH75]|nr:MAG: hypothetical protein BA863_18225 [Desulfovibrio sp. S3730MH75]